MSQYAFFGSVYPFMICVPKEILEEAQQDCWLDLSLKAIPYNL